jgi:transcriptional regulator with XRE-family HTH domain
VKFANEDFNHTRQIDLKKSKQDVLARKSHWCDRERREAYMEAAVEQGIAWQVKINRRMRGISQQQLADAIGTQQSAISRIEDPEYGSHSLDTLMSLARAFDCALSVKFISYSELAFESQRLSEAEQFAVPFSSEIEAFNVKTIESDCK